LRVIRTQTLVWLLLLSSLLCAEPPLDGHSGFCDFAVDRMLMWAQHQVDIYSEHVSYWNVDSVVNPAHD
jgi:hypothetical protein